MRGTTNRYERLVRKWVTPILRRTPPSHHEDVIAVGVYELIKCITSEVEANNKQHRYRLIRARVLSGAAEYMRQIPIVHTSRHMHKKGVVIEIIPVEFVIEQLFIPEDRPSVELFIKSLTNDECDLVVYRLNGLTYRQIADKVGVSDMAVIRRFRKLEKKWAMA